MKITADLVVFITGGASGLGEATARLLYSKGVNKMVLVDNQETKLIVLQSELPGILVF